jgi:branched-chain amino acid transport system permease protein
MGELTVTLRRNRTRLITVALLGILFLYTAQGMETEDWFITVLRGLSVGAVTFLVASGLSLIFGLLDVLNLAHGEMFMLGAYIGWTVFVRPDTFVDVLPPVLLVSVGLVLLPVWRTLLARLDAPEPVQRWGPWPLLAAGLALLAYVFVRYPIAKWDPEVYTESPITWSLNLSQGTLVPPEAATFTELGPWVAVIGTLVAGVLLGVAIAGLMQRRHPVSTTQIPRGPIASAAVVLAVGVLVFAFNTPLTDWLFALSTTWRFFVSMLVATAIGVVLGALIEMTMIRPLYERPFYQLMLTLGLSFITIEVVRTIWGRPEFTTPKPELFAGAGEGCPAETVGALLNNQCSTAVFLGSRIRTYNEIFIIFVGLVVLVAVWLLLQRTRIGMVIRAGVQDREMVEALGINVRRVFTFVFALGVGLAALGGVLAAPSIGLSTDMGTRLLLLAIIALAIGGLTSFPGAAAGAVIVGLLQQFIIKYGQIGINLPFLDEPFKPSPPLVPASTVLLMVIILLILPHGLLGRSE